VEKGGAAVIAEVAARGKIETITGQRKDTKRKSLMKKGITAVTGIGTVINDTKKVIRAIGDMMKGRLVLITKVPVAEVMGMITGEMTTVTVIIEITGNVRSVVQITTEIEPNVTNVI
jgi:hypothetical protein